MKQEQSQSDYFNRALGHSVNADAQSFVTSHSQTHSIFQNPTYKHISHSKFTFQYNVNNVTESIQFAGRYLKEKFSPTVLVSKKKNIQDTEE